MQDGHIISQEGLGTKVPEQETKKCLWNDERYPDGNFLIKIVRMSDTPTRSILRITGLQNLEGGQLRQRRRGGGKRVRMPGPGAQKSQRANGSQKRKQSKRR